MMMMIAAIATATTIGSCRISISMSSRSRNNAGTMMTRGCGRR